MKHFKFFFLFTLAVSSFLFTRSQSDGKQRQQEGNAPQSRIEVKSEGSGVESEAKKVSRRWQQSHFTVFRSREPSRARTAPDRNAKYETTSSLLSSVPYELESRTVRKELFDYFALDDASLIAVLSHPSMSGGLLFEDSTYDTLPFFLPELLEVHADSLPLAASLRKFAPIPGLQKPFNTCVGWSAAYAARSILLARKLALRSPAEVTSRAAFSPIFTYERAASKLNVSSPNYHCSHAVYMTDGLRSLADEGALPFGSLQQGLDEQAVGQGGCAWRVTESQLQAAAGARLGRGFGRLFYLSDAPNVKVKALKKALSRGLPVVIGIACPHSFISAIGQEVWAPKDGASPEFNIKNGTGHALAVIGFDDLKFGGSFQLMNSWGTRWGTGGFIWVRYNDLARYSKYGYSLDDGLAEPAEEDLLEDDDAGEGRQNTQIQTNTAKELQLQEPSSGSLAPAQSQGLSPKQMQKQEEFLTKRARKANKLRERLLKKHRLMPTTQNGKAGLFDTAIMQGFMTRGGHSPVPNTSSQTSEGPTSPILSNDKAALGPTTYQTLWREMMTSPRKLLLDAAQRSHSGYEEQKSASGSENVDSNGNESKGPGMGAHSRTGASWAMAKSLIWSTGSVRFEMEDGGEMTADMVSNGHYRLRKPYPNSLPQFRIALSFLLRETQDLSDEEEAQSQEGTREEDEEGGMGKDVASRLRVQLTQRHYANAMVIEEKPVLGKFTPQSSLGDVPRKPKDRPNRMLGDFPYPGWRNSESREVTSTVVGFADDDKAKKIIQRRGRSFVLDEKRRGDAVISGTKAGSGGDATLFLTPTENTYLLQLRVRQLEKDKEGSDNLSFDWSLLHPVIDAQSFNDEVRNALRSGELNLPPYSSPPLSLDVASRLSNVTDETNTLTDNTQNSRTRIFYLVAFSSSPLDIFNVLDQLNTNNEDAASTKQRESPREGPHWVGQSSHERAKNNDELAQTGAAMEKPTLSSTIYEQLEHSFGNVGCVFARNLVKFHPRRPSFSALTPHSFAAEPSETQDTEARENYRAGVQKTTTTEAVAILLEVEPVE